MAITQSSTGIGGGGNTPAANVSIPNGNDVVLGMLADAAITSDAAGTLSGKLRGLVKMLSDVWDGTNHRLKTDGSGVTQPVSVADGADVVAGALADAAVTTDASGSLSAKLRGLVKILNDVWDPTNHRLSVATTAGGFIDTTAADGSNVVLGALADAAVGDASGTINAHLRQIAKTLAAPPVGIAYSGTVDATHPTFDVTLAGLGSATVQIYTAAAVDQPLQLLASNDGTHYQQIIAGDNWLDYFQTGPDFSLTPRTPTPGFYGGMFTLPAGWRSLRFTSSGTITAGTYAISVRESASSDALVKVAGGQVGITAYSSQEAVLTSSGDSCVVPCQGASTLIIQVIGSFTGLIHGQANYGFQADASTNDLGPFVNLATGESSATISTAGVYQLDCAGFLNVNLNAGQSFTGPAYVNASADCGIRAAVLGQPTDVAVTGDNDGTLSAKLRGLNQILDSVWDSFNGRLIVDASQVKVPISTVDQLPYLVDKAFSAHFTAPVTPLQQVSIDTAACSTVIFNVVATGDVAISATVHTGLAQLDHWPIQNLRTGALVTYITSDGTYALDVGGFDSVVLITEPSWATGDAYIYGEAASGYRGVALGSVTDAAVGDADGTVNAHLRQIAKSLGGTLTVVTGGGFVATTAADGANTVEGATTDAAVTTDANGTLSGKLRGLVKILADVWDSTNHFLKVTVGAALPAGTNVIGGVTVANGSDAALGATTDAAVGDATGTLNAHARQIAKSLAGTVTVADSAVETTLGGTTDAAVGDATGSLNAHARQIAKSLAGTVTVADSAVETTLGGTTDAAVGDATGSINAHLRQIAKSLAAGIDVGGFSKAVTGTFTRPADTTAYAAADSMADSTSAPTAISFANATKVAAGSGFILGATLIDQANQTTKLQAYLHLFSGSPTATNDNAALAMSTTDLANYIGLIDFTGTAIVTNGAAGASGNVTIPGALKNALPFNLASGTTLYGILQANSAYTPVSAEVFKVVLNLSQDA